MASDFQCLESGRSTLTPFREERIHAGDEGGELGMFVDCGLDRRLLNCEVEVTGAVGFEQDFAELGAYSPVRLQGVNIHCRDAAAEVTFNVLNILRRLAVNVAREVQ